MFAMACLAQMSGDVSCTLYFGKEVAAGVVSPAGVCIQDGKSVIYALLS